MHTINDYYTFAFWCVGYKRNDYSKAVNHSTHTPTNTLTHTSFSSNMCVFLAFFFFLGHLEQQMLPRFSVGCGIARRSGNIPDE